jgi:Concanavalin A-like lectin/glucanases superfamily/Immunoglobulin domain
MNTKTQVCIGLALSAILCVSNAHGQTNIGQWDFKKGDLSATLGSDLGPLTYSDGPNGETSNLTIFATTKALGISSIAGVVTNVMRFPGDSALPIGYIMPTPPANGSLDGQAGDLVNNYTIICDVLYTNDRIFRPILQMDDGEFDHITAFFAVNQIDRIAVTNTQGAGLPSGQFGTIQTNTWYRIAYVLNTDIGEADVYTNGVPAGSFFFGTGLIDTPYALFPGELPCFSSFETNGDGFVNSVQLRDVALDSGQIAALGGPSASGIPINIPFVNTFVESREPNVSEENILPTNGFNIVLNEGDTTVDTNSVQVLLDGVVIPSVIVSNTPPTFTITSGPPSFLASGSVHTLGVKWTDNTVGTATNSWSFTVYPYQVINLPKPFYMETFDEVTNFGSLPAGWYATNDTFVQETNFDLCVPISASYENWLVIDSEPLCGTGICAGKGFECDTFNQGPVELNGVLITNLASNNFLYFESDNRQQFDRGQIGMVFTPDIDCSGQSNVYLCFNSLWMQNRNSFGSIEYSVDQGSNWLPALYCMANSFTSPNDFRIILTNGVIDASATFTNYYDDQAGTFFATGPFAGEYAGNFAEFMAAPVGPQDVPFIQGFPDDGFNNITTGGGVNESQWIGKEIEQLRLVGADFQKTVRFRIAYEGRCSWYWGIDNFGLYSINVPDITLEPQSVTVNDGSSASFSVDATGATPLSYQWQFDGTNIAGATSSTYAIGTTSAGSAGSYTVVVSNPNGALTSSPPAVLTVNTTPQITLNPSGEIVDLGGTVTYSTAAIGAPPFTYLWYFNDTLIQSSTSPTLTLTDIQSNQAGNYSVIVSNSFGQTESDFAALDVWAGPITSNLVAHLTFDDNLDDSSGRTNNATYLFNGTNSSTTPRYVPGFIGSGAFEYTTTEDRTRAEYASFGYPPDLQFGTNQNFSVSFWCKYSATNQEGDVPFISNKDWNSSGDQGWGVFMQSGGNYRINVTGPNLGLDKYSETDTPQVLNDGSWHNVLVSFQRAPFGQSAFVYGYLDGDLASKHPMAVSGTIDTLGIDFTNEQSTNDTFQATVQGNWAVNVGQDGTGVYCNQGSAFIIDGAIDDMGIWTRALTANEAKGIYLAGLQGQDLTQAVTAMVSASISGGNIVLTWNGNPNTELQMATDLTAGNWTTVSGTLGASSATISLNSHPAAYFRLFKQ